MPDSTDLKTVDERPKSVSRRRFIKGVIAGGAAVSSATYLFRASTSTSAAAVVGLPRTCAATRSIRPSPVIDIAAQTAAAAKSIVCVRMASSAPDDTMVTRRGGYGKRGAVWG